MDLEWLSVSEAAEKLGVSERQVRRLAGRDLVAHRLGGRWLIAAEAVRRRSRSEPLPGRPLSTAMAWAVLSAMDSAIAGRRSEESGLLSDRRVRHRLRALLADAPPSESWDRWLRHRAEPKRVWVHPGVLERLANDDRVHPADDLVAATTGDGITSGNRFTYYVDESDLGSLLEDYRASSDDDGDLVLMVVPRKASIAVLGLPGQPVSPATALVDLLSSSDARERHLAASALDDARRRVLAATKPAQPAR